MATKEKQGKQSGKGEDVEPCGAGNHVERIRYPDVPMSEQSPANRIKKMEEAGADPFEIAAAKHDVESGDITNGRQLSRDATDEEKAAGKKGDDQHVKFECMICGQTREVDQAPDKNSTVEAKDQEGSFAGTDQYRNNVNVATMGGRKVAYKIPESQLRERRVDTLRDTFEVIGVPFP